MLAILDTNILISYLLATPPDSGAVTQVVDAALQGAFTLIVPDEQLRELRRAIIAKPYLRARISDEEVDAFITSPLTAGRVLPALGGFVEFATRDPNDDYLLAAAVIANVDILVTGDRDLLVLRGMLRKPEIMTVSEFLEAIDPPKSQGS